MNNDITVNDIIINKLVELNHWVKGYNQILKGTFKYDGSMPKECTDAMYRKKIDVMMSAITYLESLPSDLILYTAFSGGYNNEYAKYLEIVNQ